MKPILVLDLEVYVNYTLLVFMNVKTRASRLFELPLSDEDRATIKKIACSHRLITFNGLGYDVPLLMLILTGATSEKVKFASDRIIVHGLKWWTFEQEFNVKCFPPALDHVDLMEIAPLTGSLKAYAARLHAPSIQDLPIEPSAVITEEQKPILREYCQNDCVNTILLYNALEQQIALREAMSETYGIDLKSKSDAQIAETVIKHECERILGRKLDKPSDRVGTKFHYRIPSWMRFKSLDILDSIRTAEFVVTDKGGVLMPDTLKNRKIELGNGVYRMGIGGLHSSEKKRVVEADDETLLMDFDVASYYPSIVLNQGLYPSHIGPTFLTVYRTLVAKRLEAKRQGMKAINEALKIAINGSFGKMGSRWSVLYAPDLMIQVTLTGQLALLMLIEMIHESGIDGEVISANTDGVTVACHPEDEAAVLNVVQTWELITEFEIERADYSALYSRDVNGYVAVKTNGEVKVKGPYGKGLPLHKNPSADICSQAVIDYLTLDASIEGTIQACQDIRKFVCVRKVTGGAVQRGEDLGRVIRWYYSSLEEDAIYYKVNNHLVPDTIGAVPCVRLPEEVPVDLDRDWYLTEAQSMLQDLGVVPT